MPFPISFLRTSARLGLVALALGWLATGTTAWAESPKEIVSSVNERWNGAFNRQDAQSLAGLYTPEATVVPPTGEVIRGREPIEGFWSDLLGKGFTDHAIDIVRVQKRGDRIHQVARWQAQGPDGDGGVKEYKGHLVTILQRGENGRWSTELHIWN